ncbi:hypothetical protein bpmyx0001_44770 [Bacillus pseudomycoides DSM 12442]|nr:hypothetical protein bpmyx0001_44770 [Bacillus pseudomycoides DSM 12442]
MEKSGVFPICSSHISTNAKALCLPLDVCWRTKRETLARK